MSPSGQELWNFISGEINRLPQKLPSEPMGPKEWAVLDRASILKHASTAAGMSGTATVFGAERKMITSAGERNAANGRIPYRTRLLRGLGEFRVESGRAESTIRM